jgi:hypothetical protein
MRFMKKPALILTLLAIPLLRVGIRQTALKPATNPTKAYILDRIHVLTGLDALFQVDSIKSVPATAAMIPFLNKELEGKTAIEVTFKRGKLNLKSGRAGEPDKYNDRQFVVLLDADAKKLLAVTSTLSKKDPDIHPELSLEEAEDYLRHSSELYVSFPTSDPKITFLEALEIVKKDGFAYPTSAQEIDGLYLMRSEMRRSARAEWIITFRGMPPMPVRYPSIPVWQRNHNREFVNDLTGKWLGGDSGPNPKE